MTNPTSSSPSVATCLRCGTQYNPAAGGDALLCVECLAAQPRVNMTMVLIAINVLVFVAMAASGVSPMEPTSLELLKWGASFGPHELSNEWWRLFTAMFVHIGLLHIGLNMYCLWSLGPLAERVFGPWRFLALYLVSGVAGNVASVGLHPMIVAAGASGAIFGVAGALLPVLHLRNIPAIVNLRGRRGRLGIGGFIVYNLMYGFASTGIDNAAHIGGLLIGFIIGYAAPVARSHTGREAEWRTRGVLIAVAIFLTATFVGVRRWRHGYAEMDLGRRALITGHTEDGIARLVRVIHDDPDNEQAHYWLGAGYMDRHMYQNAIEEFETVLRLRPESKDVFVLASLGAAYLDTDRAEQAIAPLEKAVQIQPDSARNHYNLGLAYLRTRNFRAALGSFQQAIELRPDDAIALLQHGYAYQQLGIPDSARIDYARVLSRPSGTISDDTRAKAQNLIAGLPGISKTH